MNDKETSEVARKVFDNMIERRKVRDDELKGRLRKSINFVILVLLFVFIGSFAPVVGWGALVITKFDISQSFSIVSAFTLMMTGLVIILFEMFSEKAKEENKE